MLAFLSRHQLGHRRACLPCTGAQAAVTERDCCVFIKSTREQLRGWCSLDTPPLFIPLPPAVTLTFYFSLLIHSQIIFTKKKNKPTHDLRVLARGGVCRGESGMLHSMCADVSNCKAVLGPEYSHCVSSSNRGVIFSHLPSYSTHDPPLASH